jgi:uncharacterized phage protein (predicted DNA packaging)
MTLEQLKIHLRITHSMEDDLLSIYKGFAEAEIKDSVSTSPNRDESFFQDNPIYDRAVALLTAHYYENRIAYSDVQTYELSDATTSAIQKLRGSYPYENE